MKKAAITIAFDDEKLDALEFSLKKENATVQSRMDEALRQLYEQTVPEPVREYLDSRTAPAQKPKRPPRPSRPQTAEPKAPSSVVTPSVMNAGKAGE